MHIHKGNVCRGVLLTILPLAFGAHAKAQTAAAQSGGAQESKVPVRITQAIDETNRVALRGNVHPLARAEFDRGVVADLQPMNRMLLLLQRSAEQEKALQQLMEEQQSKSSPHYHAWLTPAQFGKQFGPADEDIRAVTDWLTQQGFQVSKVSAGRTVIEFSGNVGQVRNAFHTEIHHFQVRGEEHIANLSDPEIPAALTPLVRGVVALHNFRPKPFLHSAGTFRRNAKTGEVKPAFTFSDVNGTFYAVGPADFAKIYNIDTGTATGAGQSIAVVGQSNINIQDVRDFRSVFGLPANDPMIVLNGPDPGLVSGDETESDLDVEWAGAVAQQAQIIFVTTQSTGTDFTAGVDSSAMYIVDNNVAPILSESYGQCELGLTTTGNAFYNSLWQQAAAEGITVLIASGDNGSAGCDDPDKQSSATHGLAVSGFASTPFNIAVGGTDFDDKSNPQTYWGATNGAGQVSAMGYIPETTWNDSCASGATPSCSTVKSGDLVAASGGASNCMTSNNGVCSQGYAKPTYQQGLTPADNARDVPDVSLFASDGNHGNFYIICEVDQDIAGDTGCSLTKFTTTRPFHDFQAVGGTSASTPAFAGIIALINQKTSSRQGNANYALYNTYSSAKTAGEVCDSSSLGGAQLTSNNCVFYDTTKGNVSVACTSNSLNCSNVSTAANQFGFMATVKGGTTPAFGTTAGYDLATGLGSVNVANLLAAWTSPSRTASSTTLALPAAFTVDSSVAVSGAVTPGTATGIVSLFQGSTTTGKVLDRFNVSAGGSYSGNTTMLPGGSYNVIAHYGGDGTFAPSDSTPAAVTVGKQNSQSVVSFVTFNASGTPILNTGAISVAYGSPYILRIDVENSSGQKCQNPSTFAIQFVCPTGTVMLTSNGMPLNDFPKVQNPNATNVANLNDRGFAEDQPIQLLASSTPYSIVAAYSGDASYNLSTSSPENVTITKATTTSAVTASPTSITSGGSVTLTAKVSTSSNGEAPCGSGVTNPGTVQFMNGSTPLSGTVSYSGTSGEQSSASCTATLTTTLALLPLRRIPTHTPRVPAAPLWIAAWLLFVVFLVSLKHWPRAQRRGYAYAGLSLFAAIAAGIAGCSGTGSSSSGGSSHTRSITAVYSGDANYSGSTSPAATVTVQ
jgi:subtilase family serine protease